MGWLLEEVKGRGRTILLATHIGELFWTIAWPALWVVLDRLIFTQGIPKPLLPRVKASMTLQMMGFAVMLAGMANLPASIAGDRERGVYRKFASTPIKAWEDAVGRLLALLLFSVVSSLIVLAVGMVLGSRYEVRGIALIKALGVALLLLLSSGGVGLIIGSIAGSAHSAVSIGVGVAVITSAVSGVFAPYQMLPKGLKIFSKLYPPSTSISAIIYLILGRRYAGYNPLTRLHAIYIVASSLLLHLIGLWLYHLKLWSRRL